MTKTYNISRPMPPLDPPFDFVFEWNNGEEETGIVCSLHATKKLAETFEEFGYNQELQKDPA